MKQKLQNFWYYYKIPTIIVLAILAAALWFFLQNRQITTADYDIAIVSPRGITEEQVTKLGSILESAGRDQDGNGSVKVNVSVYRFSIGEDGQNDLEVAKLDADLVGKVSGILFSNDPERFEETTNGIGKAADAVPVSGIPLLTGCGIDDLYLLIRADAENKYIELRSALTE